MTAIERVMSRARDRARRARVEFGYEVKHARIRAGLSQREVGRRLGWSGTKVSRVEAGTLETLSLDDAARLAAVVGLELSVRLYPAGDAIRDAGQSKRLLRFLHNVGHR